MPEVPPVDLGLLAGQGAQPQIGLRLGARPVASDEMAEMAGAAAIAALAHHRIEPAGGEARERLKCLANKRQVGIELRRSRRVADAWQAGLRKNTGYRAVVHPQLGGDGADAPLLCVVIAQDMRFEFRGNGHAQLLFERSGNPSGGAENLGARNPDSGSRTGGIAVLAAL